MLEKVRLTVVFAIFYIIGVISFFANQAILFGFLALVCLLFLIAQKLVSNKMAIVFYMAFALGVLNCVMQIKNYDDLSQFIPTNATLRGIVVSIPTTNDLQKTKFYLKVKSIDVGQIKNVKAKTLVTILGEQDKLSKIKIADEIELKGKLQAPFNASNPSQFDYRSYLKNHKTYSVFYVNENDWKVISQPKDFCGKFLQNLNDKRTNIINIHRKYMQSPNLEVLGGIVFGDDAVNPPEEIKNSFINSGLLHILAASGLNVSLIFGIWFFIGTKLRLNYRFIIFTGAVLVAFYTLMTGLGPSVLRAALMIEFVLLGKLFDRSADSISLVFLVAMLMLIVNPAMINDVGFQLSFVVTFALMFYCPPILEKFENKLGNFLLGIVLVPLVAQLFAAPIQMFYFNTFATYSIFANLVITPFIMVISFLGFLGSIIVMIPLGIFVEKLCCCFDFLLAPFVSGLVNISEFFANLPNSLLITEHPTILQVVLYYTVLLLLGCLIRKGIKNKKLFASFLICLFLFCASLFKIGSPSCEILVFDVGNADSFLIKTPRNKYIMIDTAHGYSSSNKVFSQARFIMGEYLKDNGIKALDLLVLTHFDSDHSGGAIDIMDIVKVKKVLLSKYQDSSKTTSNLIDYIKNNKQYYEMARNNKVVYEEPDLQIKTFVADFSVENSDNENSTVVLLSYNDFDMLFMADAGVKSFEKIKNDIPKTKIEILKSGHHGAMNTVSDAMLKNLQPDCAIISTGKNTYGHPVRETLHTLAKNDVDILRTDVNNAIKISVKNKGYKVFTYDSDKKRFVRK